MSTEISQTRYVILGTAILLAVLIAGCAGAPSGAPQTPTETPATTAAPTSPAPMTMVTTATSSPTTPAPTGNATAIPTTMPTTPTATATQTPTSPPGMAIVIQNYGFNPQTVTIPVGTTVTWTNLDTVQHQIANSGTPTIGPEQLFMSKPLAKGDTFSYTFTSAGTFQYYCIVHNFMRGTIIVTP